MHTYLYTCKHICLQTYTNGKLVNKYVYLIRSDILGYKYINFSLWLLKLIFNLTTTLQNLIDSK